MLCITTGTFCAQDNNNEYSQLLLHTVKIIIFNKNSVVKIVIIMTRLANDKEIKILIIMVAVKIANIAINRKNYNKLKDRLLLESEERREEFLFRLNIVSDMHTCNLQSPKKLSIN